MVLGANSVKDRQSLPAHNTQHLYHRCSWCKLGKGFHAQLTPSMWTVSEPEHHAYSQSFPHIHSIKSFSVNNSLQDDGMPAFSVKAITAVLLWGYNGYVCVTHQWHQHTVEAPICSQSCHFFKLLLVRKTNLFWNKKFASGLAELLHTPTRFFF